MSYGNEHRGGGPESQMRKGTDIRRQGTAGRKTGGFEQKRAGAVSWIGHCCRSAVFWMDARRGKYREAVWLIGDGRSGTTWAADLINWKGNYRELFEPFHPWRLSPPFVKHLYLRPDEKSFLDASIEKVFGGRVLDRRVNADNTGYRYDRLLVKDIFANLFAAKVKRQHAGVRIVLLLRNPFAAAVSKLRRKEWSWMTEPREFLKNSALVEDHLSAFVPLIENREDDEILKQVLIWAVIHYVPLRQFRREEICVLFYERLCLAPETELEKLFSFLGDRDGLEAGERLKAALSEPSKTADEKSALFCGVSPVDGWKEEVPESTLEKGRRILDAFGLGSLYDRNGLPCPEALPSVMRKVSDG